MWSCRTYTKALSTSFKLVAGAAEDGTASINQQNPSTPLFVNVKINNKIIKAMVDTGSAYSFIHINLLRKLIYSPNIIYQRKIHRTANNTDLRTIGLVKLKIRLENIFTYVLAEVATNLCINLVLGNDWIRENGIDIINTKQCIIKCYQSHVVSVPFTSSILSPLLPTQRIKNFTIPDIKCRVCYKSHDTKKKLFEHLYQTGHYSTNKIYGINQQIPPEIFERIKDLTEHIENVRARQRFESLLIKNAQLFDTSKPTAIKSIVKHTIDVINTRPIVQRPYRKTAAQEKIISDLCDQFYRDNIIRPSQSPWSSPVVLQKKKDNTWRFCIDYRKLNEVTEKDNYPLPRIQEIFDALNGAKFFTKLDFHGGYYQVPIDENDRPKTAFITRNKLWEFNVMPQGIKNGPPTFQRIIDKVLGQYQWNFVLSYIDDIIIYSKSIDDHLQHLQQVLLLLNHANFRLNINKCEFVQKQIKFLGHMINENGIAPCPDKVRAY